MTEENTAGELPTDRVTVAVYDLASGTILQRVMCPRRDMALQHLGFENASFVEVPADTTPRDHAIDLITGAVVPRLDATAGEIAFKRTQLVRAAEDAAPLPADFSTLLLKAAGGDKAAMQDAADLASARDKQAEKLGGLIEQLESTTTKADLEMIAWDNQMDDAIVRG